MSLQIALKTALAMNEYKQEIAKKKKIKDKEWDESILVNGGVAYWTTIGDNGKKKAVRVSVVEFGSEDVLANKGRFSFRNAIGNRVFLNVKSYIDADRIVREMYGVKRGERTPYLISGCAI